MRRLALGVGCVLLLACNRERDRLLADLQSDRAERRALAIHKLSAQHREEDTILFTRAARDPSATVRGEAAVALGETKSPEVADLLGELVEDSDEGVETKAASALALFPDAKSHRFLQIQFSRRGRATRRAIVEGLEAGGLKDAAAQLEEGEAKLLWDRYTKALNEGQLAEKVGAAEALGQSGRPEAVTLLLAHAKDPQIPVAAAALRGLSFSQDARAVAVMLQELTESYPELREAAVDGLRRLHAPESAGPLLLLAREGGSSSLQAIQALESLASPAAPDSDLQQALCALALEGDPAPATEAARAASARGCPLAPFKAVLARKSPEPRVLTALQTVRTWGHAAHDCQPEVMALLASKSSKVSAAAALALGGMGDAEAAGAPLDSLYSTEMKRIEPAREDWVKTPLNKLGDPNFDPSPVPSELLYGHATDNQRTGQYNHLIQQVDSLRVQRSGRVHMEHPPELAEDLDEESTRTAAAALMALAQLKAPGALERVKHHENDASLHLRTAAWVGAAFLGPEGVAITRAHWAEADLEARAAISLALMTGGSEGKQALADAARELPPGEGVVFLEALASVGAPASASGALQAILRSGAGESVLAARLLGSLKDRSALPVLLEVLADPTAPSRRDALWALGQIGGHDRSVAAQVARDLFHENPDVRAAAAQALTTVGDASQLPLLRALQKDYFRGVRDAATGAVKALAP